MKQINSYYKKKTVDISGNICNAIEYYDGTQFIEPFFDGETVGWVRDVFISHTKKRCEILIVSPDFPNIWLTMSFAELSKFGMDIPAVGSPVYLLTTKLFCGYCKEMMVGYGGTGKSGRQYHYYNCKNARKKKCQKKIISKQYIEDRVVAECLKLLTDENITFIAKMVVEECNKSPDNISVKALKKAIQEADTAIENLWRGIELGQSVEMLTERINQRKAQKAELEEQLAIEQNKKICLTEPQIHAFLDYVCDMPADDVNKRRAIINIFVHSIYLYDDYFTLIINASKKPLSVDNIPLDDIEETFSGDTYTSAECSSMKPSAPPNRAWSRFALRAFSFA